MISVNLGRAEPILAGGRRVMSAIRKAPQPGRVAVGRLGLDGDEQADPSVHGGVAKAVYAFPSEHYPTWQTLRAQSGAAAWAAVLPWGSMGENLSLSGLLEAEVWVGDRLRFADCELAVTEPRQPCFKFAAVMGFKHAVKMMKQSGHSGFYLTVIEPGSIAAGESFTVLPGAREVSVRELFEVRARRPD